MFGMVLNTPLSCKDSVDITIQIALEQFLVQRSKPTTKLTVKVNDKSLRV